ncbi:hypothetical protein [Paenibacillus sp. YYML68]|uniref:hypothetical protein n=1 Tax=Paenibacillus sp. YYML68 TaxID=2909250 RepID=UPI0024916D24|nr:hypothetical protein [Paenibacillus sp. YYML68]
MDLRADITFYNLLEMEFKYIRNIEILLEVNFPLVFTFTANDNNSYLASVALHKS